MIKILELFMKYKDEDFGEMLEELKENEIFQKVTSQLNSKTYVEARAAMKFKQFKAYKDAGFTEEQAWELIK